ncbi:putative malate dehydrogenase (decarboxylating) [Helianthus annuus]|nr:putative malate dehydrogenase (decarboxylating) [Helianthus annuus]
MALKFFKCSEGVGVLKAARRTMARILGNNKHAFKSARSQFWVVDVNVCIYSLL